jgi:hypothetical protein
MIEISLHGKTSEVIDTVEHPRYVDFPVRDSRERVSIALLEIAASPRTS